MSTPHKCPKCNGFGKLQYDPNNPFSELGTSTGPWNCNPCGGSGILWSDQRHERSGLMQFEFGHRQPTETIISGPTTTDVCASGPLYAYSGYAGAYHEESD